MVYGESVVFVISAATAATACPIFLAPTERIWYFKWKKSEFWHFYRVCDVNWKGIKFSLGNINEYRRIIELNPIWDIKWDRSDIIPKWLGLVRLTIWIQKNVTTFSPENHVIFLLFSETTRARKSVEEARQKDYLYTKFEYYKFKYNELTFQPFKQYSI